MYAGFPVRITSCDPARRVRIRRIALLQDPRELHLLRIDVRDRQPLQRAALAHMSTAHQSAIPGTASRATAQRRLVVERRP